MIQQGQVFELKRASREQGLLWAYRYRVGGRGSKRVQRGGFATGEDAVEALERELERVRRERRVPRSLTLAELVDVYLAQHDVAAGDDREAALAAREGDRRLRRAAASASSARRRSPPGGSTLSPGYRFEATQALRQVLARAVVWGMIDVNPAKARRRQPDAAPQGAAPVRVLGGARCGRGSARRALRADGDLRRRDWASPGGVDRARKARHRPRGAGRLRSPLVHARVELKLPKTEASQRAVPLQAIALDALDRAAASQQSRARVSGRARRLPRPAQLPQPYQWKPAQCAAGIDPLRRVYDLRHTFATFALRAGISTFDLSRYMGASLTMIDRHYGHLARDGREHAIRLLDELSAEQRPRWTLVDAAWTSKQRSAASAGNGSTG